LATFILLFLPIRLKGYLYLIHELEKALCNITGFAAVSFQPNSGAAGEYTGLMVYKYHASVAKKSRCGADTGFGPWYQIRQRRDGRPESGCGNATTTATSILPTCAKKPFNIKIPFPV